MAKPKAKSSSSFSSSYREKAKVSRPVLFELAADLDELFPHIYGPLNLDSVVEVIKIA